MISTFTAEAQRQSIDTDILALRNAAVPSFNWHYDDYLQYGPAGVMLGLKAFGYEGRSSWGGDACIRRLLSRYHGNCSKRT